MKAIRGPLPIRPCTGITTGTTGNSLVLAFSLSLLIGLCGCSKEPKNTSATPAGEQASAVKKENGTATPKEENAANSSSPAQPQKADEQPSLPGTDKTAATGDEKQVPGAGPKTAAQDKTLQAPAVIGDDLPQISAASKKVPLDGMPDSTVICLVNGTPITVGAYKHEFKMRETQTQAYLSASPELEQNLLQDAASNNITLTDEEKKRLIETAHKAEKATGDVLKQYLKDNKTTTGQFDKRVLDIGLALKDAAYQTRQTLLQELVDQQILIGRARAKGYDSRAFNKYIELKRSPQYQKFLEDSGFSQQDAQTQLVNRQLIMMAVEDIKKSTPATTDKELQEVYNMNKPQLKHGERVRLSQIIIAAPEQDMPGAPSIRTQVQKQNPNLKGAALEAQAKETEETQKKKAEAVLAQALKPGADFAKLVEKNSDDPMAKEANNGGDLGFKDLNHLQSDFVAKIKTLKVGQIYPNPIRTQYGYHIVKLTGTEGPGYIPLSEVRADIVDGIDQRKQMRAINDFLLAQHKTADIKLSPQFQTLIAQDSKSDTKAK